MHAEDHPAVDHEIDLNPCCCDNCDPALNIANGGASPEAGWSCASSKGRRREPSQDCPRDQTLLNKLEQKPVNGANGEDTRRSQGLGAKRMSLYAREEAEQHHERAESQAGPSHRDVSVCIPNRVSWPSWYSVGSIPRIARG